MHCIVCRRLEMEQEKEVTSALVSALVVDAERKKVGDAIKQKRGFFGNFSQRGGGLPNSLNLGFTKMSLKTH